MQDITILPKVLFNHNPLYITVYIVYKYIPCAKYGTSTLRRHFRSCGIFDADVYNDVNSKLLLDLVLLFLYIDKRYHVIIISVSHCRNDIVCIHDLCLSPI